MALMVAVVGLLWPELRLSARASKVLFLVTVPMNYYTMAALVVIGLRGRGVPATAGGE